MTTIYADGNEARGGIDTKCLLRNISINEILVWILKNDKLKTYIKYCLC